MPSLTLSIMKKKLNGIILDETLLARETQRELIIQKYFCQQDIFFPCPVELSIATHWPNHF